MWILIEHSKQVILQFCHSELFKLNEHKLCIQFKSVNSMVIFSTVTLIVPFSMTVR